MKTKKKCPYSTISQISLFVILLGLASCSKSKDDVLDDSVNCDTQAEQYLAKAAIYSEASQTYTNDPTLINCQNYKTAGLNYIASLEDFIECVPTIGQQEFLNDLNDYKAEVNAIECN